MLRHYYHIYTQFCMHTWQDIPLVSINLKLSQLCLLQTNPKPLELYVKNVFSMLII